mmetsp:Transcript_90778/g.261555  ORF Transcript_90778/g.261555 Transcript_90778/m.261555 type:complete len:473 (+) Transcript_90778:75-1493(+)
MAAVDLPTLRAPPRPELAKFCRPEPLKLEELKELKALLHEKGTLDIARAKCKDAAGNFTGPFSASAANAKGDHTGSSMFGSWLRDNSIIAYGLYITDPDGQGCEDAKACLNAIAKFMLTHESQRMELVINGHKDVTSTDPKTWMDRPHIRFIGETGLEDTKWYNHKQNDALGYFMWARIQLALAGKYPLSGDHFKLMGQLFDFLRTIECWNDLDAGHWEEHSAQHASSLGPCLAATKAFKELMEQEDLKLAPCKPDTLEILEKNLEAQLNAILPNETITPAEHARDADSALIFLCYPLQVVDDRMGLQIVDRLKKLMGDIAMCRYRKDSYWCKDYKEKVGDDPTKHFTDEELKERDAMLQPGEEAQWCLFDPMVSAFYGKLYQKTGNYSYLKLQQLFLSRALAAITGDDCEFGPWMCCEAYYLTKGEWKPNDNTPLVWTQVDLKMALHEMEKSLSPVKKRPAALKRPASAMS